ncbi:hypothetical protein ACPPVO_16075 [Dactylosporangium sp. McL0621]|uniref:RipA family octameric membrane protein n=1 Tax=Dactylosporangium sp. McL0621 TaxID=3415678 RepID=UPI003CF9E9C0
MEVDLRGNYEDPQDVRDQANRIWSHALHNFDDLVQRNNFFLIAESMIVVAYSAILASGTSGSEHPGVTRAAAVISAFGLMLTAVWAYVCHVQWVQVKVLRIRAAEALPEYRTTLAQAAQSRLSPTALMTYAVPALAAVMWILLFALAL